MSDFGARLYEIRKQKGYSQAKLSKVSGVSQQAISNIETGTRSPTEETMKMLAEGLRIPLSDLLNEKKPTANDGDGPKEKLIDLLVSVPEQDAQRVRDFVAGLIAARRG